MLPNVVQPCNAEILRCRRYRVGVLFERGPRQIGHLPASLANEKATGQPVVDIGPALPITDPPRSVVVSAPASATGEMGLASKVSWAGDVRSDNCWLLMKIPQHHIQ